MSAGEGTKMTDDRRPLRQFSVSLAESVHRQSLSVVLRWRTFPCAAQHWDGVRYAEVPWTEGPIQSQEALRDALMAAALTEWVVRPGTRA